VAHPEMQLAASMHQIKTLGIEKLSLLDGGRCGLTNFADKQAATNGTSTIL